MAITTKTAMIPPYVTIDQVWVPLSGEGTGSMIPPPPISHSLAQLYILLVRHSHQPPRRAPEHPAQIRNFDGAKVDAAGFDVPDALADKPVVAQGLHACRYPLLRHVQCEPALTDALSHLLRCQLAATLRVCI